MFKLYEKTMMFFDRKYFCKEELKNKKCSELRKQCCMWRHVCKL